jgi:DNA-binding PadR family transcriptional regulator
MHGAMAYGDEASGHGSWRDLVAWKQRMAMREGAEHHGHGHRGRRGFGPGGRGFGPWGAGPWGPGPFFGRGPKVGRGDVRTAILVLLGEQPMHGYQIIQELGARSGGVWRPSPGSVYPTLQQLEDEGLVHGQDQEGKRVFQLTDAGKAEVDRRGEDAAPPWDLTEGAGPLMDLRDVGFGVAAAVMQVAQTGNDRQIARAREILTEARKQLYRLLGEDEPAGESNGPDAG